MNAARALKRKKSREFRLSAITPLNGIQPTGTSRTDAGGSWPPLLQRRLLIYCSVCKSGLLNIVSTFTRNGSCRRGMLQPLARVINRASHLPRCSQERAMNSDPSRHWSHCWNRQLSIVRERHVCCESQHQMAGRHHYKRHI